MDFLSANSGFVVQNDGTYLPRITRETSTAMGGFQCGGTGKNKKVIENSPLLAFWPERAKE